MIAVEFASYVGSFPVSTSSTTDNDDHHHTKATNVRDQLKRLREDDRQRRPILLVISLAGIKMCSIDGKNVFMAHALRRISYATCDSTHRQFSFLAREPKGHFSLQHCHSFITETAEQAEELNTIVGNAFRTAYLTQLQRESQIQQQSTQSEQQSSSASNQRKDECDNVVVVVAANNGDVDVDGDGDGDGEQHHHHHSHDDCHTHSCINNYESIANSCPDIDNQQNHVVHLHVRRRRHQYQYKRLHNSYHDKRRLSSGDNCDNLNNRRFQQHSADSSPARTRNLNNIRTLTRQDSEGNIDKLNSPTEDMNLLSDDGEIGGSKNLSGNGDDEPNSSSPTIELNCYHRLLEKPPLRHKQPLLQFLLTPTTSPMPMLSTDNSPDDNDQDGSLDDEELRPLVSSSRRMLNTSSRINDERKPINFKESSTLQTDVKMHSNVTSPPSSEGYMDQSSDGGGSINTKLTNRFPHQVRPFGSPTTMSAIDRRSPFIIRERSNRSSRNSNSSTGSERSSFRTPPPLPDRYDSLQSMTMTSMSSKTTVAVASDAVCEDTELRRAGWFQAGIPREVALEILSQEPIGAFMVRASESKPSCFALSLRVPRSTEKSTTTTTQNDNCESNSIAHYLITKTNRGYKIKGFTKEFTTLSALITHHSVMPELLPCPLNLSRYNPSFSKHDSNQDFADLDDEDPDYNTVADFCKMMADIGV